MPQQLSNYEIQQLELFEQELFNSNTLSLQAQELKHQFFVLLVSSIAVMIWLLLYLLHRASIHQLPWWPSLFLLFPLMIYQIRNYHKSYLLKKKAFAQSYKQFLIPQMLKSLQADYHYTAMPNSTEESYHITTDKGERNINQDIEKIIESWLWEGSNQATQKSYAVLKILTLLNPYGLLLLFFRRFFISTVAFEDFFTIEQDKARFTAVEIQNFPLVFKQSTTEDKFLAKFSYEKAKYLLHNDRPFFVKLSSLKTKIKTAQFEGKRVWCYVFLLFTMVIPLFIFAFLERDLESPQNSMIFLSFGIIFLVMYTMFAFDLDPRKFKKAEFENPLADAVRWSVLFSQDFLDYYDIKTNDQVYANAFLDPSLKEKLMLLHQHYKGNYDFYFEGKDFYCIKHLPKGKHFLDSFSHRNRKHPKTLTKLYAEIKELDLLFSLLKR